MKRILYFFILMVVLSNCVFVLAENTDKAPDFYDIVFNGEYYVAVGEKGSVITSFDGLNWSLGSVGSDKNLYGITWGLNKFVAAGEEGVIFTSEDGKNWTKRDSDISSDIYGIEGNGDKFIAVGDMGKISCVSMSEKMVENKKWLLWRS